MTDTLIPEFHQRLLDMRQSFTSEAQSFVQNVRVSTQRFTDQDRIDFDALLAEIREFALTKIKEFINSRLVQKSVSFDTHFDSFHLNSSDLSGQLSDFKSQLEEAGRKLKVEQVQKEQLLDRISDKYAYTETLKNVMRAFRSNADRRSKKRNLQRKMEQLYQDKLKQKCLFPWRALTYKDGYQNQMRRHTQAQFRKIHDQFGSIVDILKQKVMETEEVIRVKRAAKGEFAYALSKNLLKTISNLSLQVMSLNQVVGKDRDSQEQTNKFMNQVNRTIKERLQSVTIHKDTMYQSVVNQQTLQQFSELPNPIAAPESKPKRISFA